MLLVSLVQVPGVKAISLQPQVANYCHLNRHL